MAGFRIEVLEAVANPDKILAGNSGELLAIKEHSPGRSIVAVYREAAADGFVITAFTTSRTGWMERRRQLWP